MRLVVSTLQDTHHDLFADTATALALLLVSVLVLLQTGDECLIAFDSARQFFHTSPRHDVAYSVQQEPRRFLCYGKCAGNLARADAVLGVGYQVYGREPRFEWKWAILHDSADLHAEPLLALLAVPSLAGGDEGQPGTSARLSSD